MRPFEGIRILDCTHVLAGPFAAYQLAVLGADVVKVDDPNEPDQSRESGADHELNKAMMGTGFLTQGSNKRAIALNLKTEGGREALTRLVVDWADVLVENYRPGAFAALGLGYEDLTRLKPTLIYASMTAFGHGGPRGTQTAYDHAIQATSGITASTGTEASGPIKTGAPMVDYATGTMGAFAISAALFQRMRTGQGQHIDLAMLDVAMILQGSCASPRRRPSPPRTAWSSSRPAMRASTVASTRRSTIPMRPSGRACRSATTATPRSWPPWPRR
jgi:crotonobetainyl-CoA:carnitine CoA-transferase CaiB-like acyl-CoA transferase